MQHLFSNEGEAALTRIIQQQPLLAFDFDGTLAAIVPRPGDARATTAVSARLAALAAQLPVAIVTGRSIEDVRGRLGFTPRFIVGNHGAEAEEGTLPTAALGSVLDPVRERLLERQTDLAVAGVTVEDKGHSLALHYRLSRTRERALDLIASLLAPPDEGTRIFGGKLVVNVVPSQAPDKAQALMALLTRCGATTALFAGDDVTDEPIFAAAPAHWLTIRVGRDDSKSRAMYFLDSPIEMAMALEKMVSMRCSVRHRMMPQGTGNTDRQ